MGININLLQNQKDYNKLDNAFRIGRIIIVIVGVVCFVTLAVVFGLRRNAQQELTEAESQLVAIQQEINSLQAEEARIVLINEKMKSMNNIIAEQPDFSRNLETFIAFMPDNLQDMTLERVSLEENSADFIVSFDTVLSLSQFITVLESPDFQHNFSVLKTDNIDVSDANNKFFITLNVTF